MRPPAYCGVSGLTTPAQVRALFDTWPSDAPTHSLMLGVLTSEKVKSGGERNPRSADPAAFKEIFALDRPGGRKVYIDDNGTPRVTRTLNLIHYFTRNQSGLGEQLLHVCAHAGELCDGAQINAPWPAPAQVKHFLDYGGWDRVVLQVGPKALASVGFDDNLLVKANAVAERLDQYQGLITDVLIDGSGGRGVPLDIGLVKMLVETIRLGHRDWGITIAGGLCASALPAVASLVREYGLSIDAEGRLRDALDEFDLGEAIAYTQEAYPLVCPWSRR